MLNRRTFTTALLAMPALLRAQQNAAPAKPIGTPGAMAGFHGASLTDLPKGYTPTELGRAVVNHFLPAPHLRSNRIIYPEVCLWWGSLEFAHLAKDAAMLDALQKRFEPLFTTEAALQPPRGEHVDLSMFGSLPLELYLLTKDKRYLDLGLSYADAQWSKPNEQGLTHETRFWIDDMWMITILQVQAFRASGDPKYLDRAASEVAAYLDKLQQPNGLFFHAPDVPYFWSRGNGWFAAGMTELLSELPTQHPKHERIVRGYKTMMLALVKYQSPEGAWHQLIDNPESFTESSGTGMFAFALITGVKKGWLDPSLSGAARKAWISLAGFVDQNADVTACCEGTNKYDSLEYYLLRKRKTGDFHGQAAFMWATNAMLRS